MHSSEEQIVTALRTLFASIESLRQIELRDIIKPETYSLYENALQSAYDSLTQVEDALTSLGMKLEYHHWRLGGAMEELKPLLIQMHSFSDMIS